MLGYLYELARVSKEFLHILSLIFHFTIGTLPKIHRPSYNLKEAALNRPYDSPLPSTFAPEMGFQMSRRQ